MNVPQYPRGDPQPLRGWQRLRFMLRLWRRGYPTVRSFQRRAQFYPTTRGILQDGMVGPQTWTAFWSGKPLVREFGPVFILRGMLGLRALGWQFDVTDHRKVPPLFSERYGYERHPHVGPFCFRGGRLLRP